MEIKSEQQLIEEYRAGSEPAINELLSKNEALVNFVYERNFKLCGCPKEDMVQEGYLGFLEAVRRFNPEKAAQFNTYKVIWIKKKMFDFRKKHFKNNFCPLPADYDFTPATKGWAETLNDFVFELDNLSKSGRIGKKKANLMLAKLKKKV